MMDNNNSEDEKSYNTTTNKNARTNVSWENDDLIININEGVKDSDLDKYYKIINLVEKDSDKLKYFSIDDLREIRKILRNNLNNLYTITEKTRDKYIKEDLNLNPDEIWKNVKSITMPINIKVFDLQKKYYNLLTNIYDLIEAKHFRKPKK